MKRVLLFGRSGQVGGAVGERLQLRGMTREEADFADPVGVARHVTGDFDAVINAAAYTAVDAAEDDRATAFAVNAEAVGQIGRAAEKNGVFVVHYSTDYVFDGTRIGPYGETDAPNPLSAYGASKLEGERLLLASGARAAILRTSWVYAPRGRNFALTMLKLARERETLDVVDDQIGAPTPASLVAEITARLVTGPVPGLYHLAPHGETSWHGYARFLVAEALAAGAHLKLMPDAIRPIGSRDYPQKAARPKNSRLSTLKLRETLGVELPHWQDGVRELITMLKAEGRL